MRQRAGSIVYRRALGHTLPIWAHLVVFALCVVIPLCGLVFYIGLNSLRRERTEYQNQTMIVARSFAVDLDRELASLKSILTVLATSVALADGDLQRFHDQAARVTPEDSVIVLRDRSGQPIVSTLYPFGTTLPRTRASAVLDADRCVLETRSVCASNLYVGTTDQQPYVLLDAPVMRDGQIQYFLNIAVRAKRLAALLRDHRTPDGWAISILDRQDRLIARSVEHDRFVGSYANEALRRNSAGQEGTVRAINIAGVPVWGAYVRLPSWGWRVAIGVPEAVLTAPLHRSMIYLGGLGLGAVALSLAVALFYGRRLAGAIALLSRQAARVGDDAAPEVAMTPVREVNRVSASLAEASRRLTASIAERDRAQAAMRQLNEDLEARVAAEIAARENAQSQALQAQRIQALGQLAGGIAHDFNNVLQSATGCADAIIRRADNPEAVRRFAELLLGAADRGKSVTRRLLGFAQRTDLRAELIDLHTVFGGLREILSHTLGTHISVALDLPAHLPAVLADKGQLEAVLINLATNARDAMPSGGSLTFGAEVEIGTAEAGALAPGDYVRIDVVDTGSGMDAATLARASEPFFTTKGPGVGNGLGLAMARGFAQQSGGKLELQSAPGRGTTVRLWLPARPNEAPAARQGADASARPAASARRKILLVEDEDIVRSIISTQLADEGYDVLPVAGADDALALLTAETRVDALVTDFNMPGMNGIELIRACRARGLALPAILLTGNAEHGIALATDGALAEHYSVLGKPVSGTSLADRLAAVLEPA